MSKYSELEGELFRRYTGGEPSADGDLASDGVGAVELTVRQTQRSERKTGPQEELFPVNEVPVDGEKLYRYIFLTGKRDSKQIEPVRIYCRLQNLMTSVEDGGYNLLEGLVLYSQQRALINEKEYVGMMGFLNRFSARSSDMEDLLAEQLAYCDFASHLIGLILKRRREADPDRKLAASFVGEIGEVEPPEAKPAVKTTSFQKLSKWIRSGGRKS